MKASLHSIGLTRVAPLVLDLLRDTDARGRSLWSEIDRLMHGCFAAAGMGHIRRRLSWWYLKRAMQRAARAGESLPAIEARLRPRFRSYTEGLYLPAARERAERVYQRLVPFLKGTRVLDLGAGNGLIAEALRQRAGVEVTLIDVLDYRLVDLPLLRNAEGERLPLDDGSVDTTLIYLVLHHADDPDLLLREAVRVTRERIIIMEGLVEDERTRQCNCFLDWFLNRVVQGADLNIPLNYRTIAEWQEQFAACNLRLVHTDPVGIDEPRAPEAHILYVLDRGEVAAVRAS